MRGKCNFYEKVGLAHNAGAIGLIIINSFQTASPFQVNEGPFVIKPFTFTTAAAYKSDEKYITTADKAKLIPVVLSKF